MKQGWELKKLGEVCRFINGRAYYQNELLKEGKYPVLRVGNFYTNKNWYYSDLELPEDKYCDKGDLLYAWSASFGPRIWEGEKVIYHYHIWKVEPNEKLIRKDFLFQLLEWDTEAIKTAHGTGTTMMHVGKGSIENRQVPLPPLPEQQRIVSILDECFASIAKAKANAEQNLKNAKELFESYLQGVFENENWETKTFDEVCQISSKLIDPRKSEYQNFIHVGAGNIESMTGKLADLKTAKEDNLISGKFLFDESMVLYSKIRPYLMKVVNSDFQGLCSADIYPLKPYDTVITKDYLYHLLLTREFTDYAIFGSQRAGMPKVNREHLFAYKFKLPSIKKQQTIVRQLDALRAETQKLEAMYQKKIADLEELKKSILQKAFNGELKERAIAV